MWDNRANRRVANRRVAGELKHFVVKLVPMMWVIGIRKKIASEVEGCFERYQ